MTVKTAAETGVDTHDTTGPVIENDVDAAGNDAFASAFDSFASGDIPDPNEDDDGGADDQAGQDGADEDGGDTPPSEGDDKDPPEPAPGDKPAAGAEEAPDPWANASPELLAARDKLVADYENKVRGASGRASGLQRKLTELQRRIPAEAPGNDDQDGKQDKSAGAKALDDKIAKLQEEYPEIAGPLVEMLQSQAAELRAVKANVAPVIDATEAQLVQAEIASLEEKHPDWREFAPGKNTAFDGWKESQPDNVKALADSDFAQDVAVALTLFKVERAEAMRKGEGDKPEPKPDATDARRKRQMDGGALVTSRRTPAATGAPDDFEGAFASFAAKAQK